MGVAAFRFSASRQAAIGLGFLLGVALIFGSAEQAQALTPPTVGLGTADSYEVLAATTVTNTLATVVNNGDVGLSPGTAVVGFPPGVINNGVIHATDAQAEQAQADLTTAYNDAAGRIPDQSNIIDLAGQTLVPGVYSGGALSLTGTVTLNGTASSVFIFQAASTLITSSASTVAFTGGANQCNVFWQVGSSATLGSNSVFAGTIMALASITADTGATVTGRLFARTGAVTLDSNVITRSSDCAARSAIVASTPSSATLRARAAAAAALAASQAAAATAAAAAARAAAARAAALAATGTNPTLPIAAAILLLSSGVGLILGHRRMERRLTGRHRADYGTA